MIEFYAKMLALFTAEREDEKGATAVEYGLLVALIAAVIVGLVATLGTEISGGFQDVINELQAN
ncbi:Flp family type IVb pilin [Nocardioides dubius]|uniref:Flp family type IVb pilin n=1 Tax=Nocardioides dubius TaxID=317019 RepID=A0ABP4E9T6_9ACTN